MTLVGLRRLLADWGVRLSVEGVGQRNPTNGRQGKSAACGRAHMVGWLDLLGPFYRRAGWRSSSKPERFQRPDRRLCPAELAYAP